MATATRTPPAIRSVLPADRIPEFDEACRLLRLEALLCLGLFADCIPVPEDAFLTGMGWLQSGQRIFFAACLLATFDVRPQSQVTEIGMQVFSWCCCGLFRCRKFWRIFRPTRFDSRAKHLQVKVS